MKHFIVKRGKYTEAGNLTGRNALGVKCHVPKALLASVDWTTEEDIEYPFLVVTETQVFDILDDAGEPTGEKSEPRLTAIGLFRTEDELAEAYLEEASSNVRVSKKILSATANGDGLTAEEIEQMRAYSF